MVEHELPPFIPPSVGIGDQHKVTISVNARDATPLRAKERAGNDLSANTADRWFLASLVALYGRQAFPRGNLDAGRINRLFDREIVPADRQSFDSSSFDAELRVDMEQTINFFSQSS